MTRDGTVAIRDGIVADVEPLADLWFEGRQDAHAGILPAQLARLRTRESFRDRLAAGLPALRVAERGEVPVGFTLLKGDELDQFYVSAEARGGGIAQTLMADALARLRAGGTTLAWLACAIGNHRAARFYEKAGWRLAGTVTHRLQTGDGVFPLEVWRFEINLLS